MSSGCNIFKGRKSIRNILSHHPTSAPLWNLLKRFNFVVSELDAGYVIRLVAFDRSSVPYTTLDEVMDQEAVSIGTHFYSARSGQRSIDILALHHLYEQWNTPLFHDARLIAGMLYPTISVGGPRPIQLPNRDVQNMNIRTHQVGVKPHVPNWVIPFIFVADALGISRKGKIIEYYWDYSAFPRMFYARIHGTDAELDTLAAVCDHDGLLYDFRNQIDPEYESSMRGPGCKSATRYAIVTNMILDRHAVAPKHIAHKLRLVPATN